MKLFIAEKPSMARELAKCLPEPHQRGNGCIRTGGGIVTWLMATFCSRLNPRIMIPSTSAGMPMTCRSSPKSGSSWSVRPARTSSRSLRTSSPVPTSIPSSTRGPDREGQLLIDEILDYVGNKKPVERILLNALDEKSIHESLDDLRSNGDFVHLKESAGPQPRRLAHRHEPVPGVYAGCPPPGAPRRLSHWPRQDADLGSRRPPPAGTGQLRARHVLRRQSRFPS